MIAALAVAFLAGAVSFASPCVLPLVPGYLGYLGGMSGTLGQAPVRRARSGGASLAVSADSAAATATRVAAAPARGRTTTGTGRLLAGVLLFVAGFSAVFVLLGVVFGWMGLALAPWVDVITRVMGVVVILMGLAFMGFVPFLQRDRRLHLSPRAGLWGAPALGIVFGLGWAPCIGPTLSAVLLLSLDGGSAGRGGMLALAYCAGLGLPFVLIALAYARSTRAIDFLRRHRLTIMRVGGGLLVVVGLALVTGLWGVFTGWVQGLVANFSTVV
ncbi:cytochrome c biogenesis CcdA family protein [Georgenia sunbinii]|uniref:cytochrome c biogenesis CcdA family protein n=1 Tax=Georgenia sunbinii TaxID=3117728 RepID=UPI003D9BFFEF